MSTAVCYQDQESTARLVFLNRLIRRFTNQGVFSRLGKSAILYVKFFFKKWSL